MSTYELPDGFEGMETAPKNTWVNVIDASGNYGRDIYLEGRDIYRFAPMWIGWSPVVPPKKKRRFVVKAYIDPDGVTMYRVHTTPPHLGGWIAERLPNESSAQAVADIYEQAYEVTP